MGRLRRQAPEGAGAYAGLDLDLAHQGDNMTTREFASMVDHSYLRAYATEEELEKLCSEAKAYGFKSVAVNSYPIAFCHRKLEGSGVLVGAAISFPLGQTTIETKVEELRNAIKDGADEADYVINIGKAKEHDWSYLEEEMAAMVREARIGGIAIKVIFETCYLMDEEIIELAAIASRVKPDFVKTSTGFGTAGATPRHVALMKKHAGSEVQVKAAGGIRTWKDAKALIEAGATRIGCSAGIKIIEEMKEEGLE